jgi:hypothetical protein
MSSDGLVEPTVGSSDFPRHPVLGGAPTHVSGSGVLEDEGQVIDVDSDRVRCTRDRGEPFAFECLDGRGQRWVHEYPPAARRSSAAMALQPVHRTWPGRFAEGGVYSTP